MLSMSKKQIPKTIKIKEKKKFTLKNLETYKNIKKYKNSKS